MSRTTRSGGRSATFAEAFPAVESAEADITESDGGTDEWPVHWDSRSGGEFVDCSNPLCYNGGFAVGQMLRSMVSDRATEREFDVSCQGYEGSPKGRTKYRECLHSFSGRLRVRYRDQDAGRPG